MAAIGQLNAQIGQLESSNEQLRADISLIRGTYLPELDETNIAGSSQMIPLLEAKCSVARARKLELEASAQQLHTAIGEQEQAILALQEMSATLAENLAEWQASNAAYETQILYLQEQNALLIQNYSAAAASAAAAASQVVVVTEPSVLQTGISQLQTHDQQLMSELQTVGDQLAGKCEQLLHKSASFSLLQAAQTSTTTTSVDMLEARVRELHMRNIELLAELDSVRAESEHVASRCGQLEQQLAVHKASSSSSSSSEESSDQVLKQQVREYTLQNLIGAQRKLIVKLGEEYAAKERELEERHAQVCQLLLESLNDVETMKREMNVDEIEGDINSLIQKLNEIKEENETTSERPLLADLSSCLNETSTGEGAAPTTGTGCGVSIEEGDADGEGEGEGEEQEEATMRLAAASGGVDEHAETAALYTTNDEANDELSSAEALVASNRHRHHHHHMTSES